MSCAEIKDQLSSILKAAIDSNSEFADEYNRLVKATKNRRNKIDLPRYLSKRKQTNLKNSLKEQQKLLQGILNQSEAAKIARSE